MKINEIVIIGAGLAGLTAAYYLDKLGLDSLILESRARLGGRIHTIENSNEAPIEMGATWVDLNQRMLMELLEELDVKLFEQYLGQTAIYEQISTSPAQIVRLPSNDNPSFRIEGGTISLINALLGKLDQEQIFLETAVSKIEFGTKEVLISTTKGDIRTKKIINTLSPNLFVKSVKTIPEFSNDLRVVMANTYTWMGDSIKVSFTYRKRFWVEEDLSGTIFSNVGPINEMYDQTDANQEQFALTGFINSAYHSLSLEDRKSMILDQLKKYYGHQVLNFITYHEALWRNEKYTYVDYDSHVLPRQNNGHEIFQKAHFNKRLFFAGAEIGVRSKGHMEAAVASAKRVAFDIASLEK